MKFEDALKAMREGKKIRDPSWEKDVYLIGCYVTSKLLNITFQQAKENGMSIVKMKNGYQHPDMRPKNWPDKQNCCDPELHSYPQLCLLSIMREDWEVVDE